MDDEGAGARLDYVQLNLLDGSAGVPAASTLRAGRSSAQDSNLDDPHAMPGRHIVLLEAANRFGQGLQFPANSTPVEI